MSDGHFLLVMAGIGKKENGTAVGSKPVFSVQDVISSTFDR